MKTLVIISLLLLPFFTEAGDTTLLRKRQEKVKAFFSDLRKAPDLRSRDYPTKEEFEIFTPLIKQYFKPPSPSTEFAIGEHIYQMKGLFNLRDSMPDFKLKYPDPKNDSITDVTKLTGYLANTLILYVSMYDDDWEMAYFAFAPESDQMIFMVSAGGEDSVYRRKKHFINELYSPQKK